eukprot:gene19347-25995_t
MQQGLVAGHKPSLVVHATPIHGPSHRLGRLVVRSSEKRSGYSAFSGGSSWGAKEKGSEKDFLHALGANQDYNINVSHGQNVAYIDALFVGNTLGQHSDIADGSLRNYEFRTFNNIVGDYYISPRFLEKVAIHFAKNYLVATGVIDSKKAPMPLLLGIWGEKGMGKSFQTELVFKKLGVEAVIMSAGELEHEWAGTPGRLIRERYRKAADMSKTRGKFTCLMINDIDAGIGHQKNTQMTVNNQIVTGTLMNICDDPTRVSIGSEWNEKDIIRRTPIIVTGNDLSKIFAPLLRDGRMDKFYWNPSSDELVNILYHMYKASNLHAAGTHSTNVPGYIEWFGQQPLDFFGALRASTYDHQIRAWLVKDVVGTELMNENANLKGMMRRLATGEDLPVFTPVDLTIDMLIKEGERLEYEQEMVNTHKLSQEYFKSTGGYKATGNGAALMVSDSMGSERMPIQEVQATGKYTDPFRTVTNLVVPSFLDRRSRPEFGTYISGVDTMNENMRHHLGVVVLLLAFASSMYLNREELKEWFELNFGPNATINATDRAYNPNYHRRTNNAATPAPVVKPTIPDPQAACKLEGNVTGCGCDYASVEYVIHQELQPVLRKLVQMPFFAHYKVNLYCDCEFWPDESMCFQEDCCVKECEEKEIPETWRKAEQDKLSSDSSDSSESIESLEAMSEEECEGGGSSGAGVDKAVGEGAYLWL